MEATHEATKELIAKLQDPSRRWTEIYIQGKDFREHIKLRENVDDNLTTI